MALEESWGGADGADGASEVMSRRICPEWKSADELSWMHFLCCKLRSQYRFGVASVVGARRASFSRAGKQVCAFREMRW